MDVREICHTARLTEWEERILFNSFHPFSSGITVLLRVDPRWRLPTRRWVRSALLDPLQRVRLQRHAVDLATAQHWEFIVHDEVRGHLVLGQALQ